MATSKEELKKFRILVVEDEEALRKAVEYEFKRCGFTVFSADNGTSAFEIVRKEKVDLVVSDIRMPNGSGMEMLEKIRAFNPRIPIVVFMTGFSDFSEEDCLAKGAQKVFAKPFDRKALIRYVMDSLPARAA